MTVRAVLVAVLAILIASPAGAIEFYSATAPRLYNPLDLNSMYYNLPGSRPRILFDDVTVPFSAPTSRFQVTKVTVQISRTTGAPAVTVTPYYSQIVSDGTYNGGSNDLPEFPDLSPPTTFGSPEALPGMGGASFTETSLSFGNGTSTLFIVPGSTVGLVPGFHSFAIGLELSSASGSNGWTLAMQSNNRDLLWDYVSSTNFSEFTYATDSQGAFVVGTQYLRVEGQVVSGLGGDANADGKVNAYDLLALATNWLQPGDYSHGDFNFDGIVNATDLGILGVNWQSTASLSEVLPSMGLAGVVPEPASLSLVAILLPLAMRRRERSTA